MMGRLLRWPAWAWLVVIGALALVVLLLTWDARGSTSAAVVRDASIDVLAVALVGAVVSLVVGRLRADAEQRQREKEEERAEARRIDERAAEFAQQLVISYNGVKRVRRLLDAELSRTNPMIDRETYLRQMSALCDLQLEFEALKRRAPVLSERIGDAPPRQVMGKVRKDDRTKAIPPLGLTGAYAWRTATLSWEAEDFNLAKACGEIEHNLNEIVEEFQQNLPGIRHGVPVSVIELKPPDLKAKLVDGEPSGAMLPIFVWDTDCFRARVTRYVDAALDYLDGRLLRSGSTGGSGAD